jgi:hypothetical protein
VTPTISADDPLATAAVTAIRTGDLPALRPVPGRQGREHRLAPTLGTRNHADDVVWLRDHNARHATDLS